MASLPTYFPLTGLGQVRIGLAVGIKKFSLTCGGEFVISGGTKSFLASANTFYTLQANGDTVAVTSRATGSPRAVRRPMGRRHRLFSPGAARTRSPSES